MKILWLVNVILPQIADSIGCEAQSIGGWLVKLSQRLAQTDGIELTVIFPHHFSAEVLEGKTVDGYAFFGFPTKRAVATNYNQQEEKLFVQILAKQLPDIVHIWGTEYIHSLEMFRAFSNPAKCIVSLQGIISYISKYYMADLPHRVKYSSTIRDILRNDRLWQQQKRFEKRGIYEQKLLREAQNVIGRTDWDRAICQILNPQCKYFKCNEILRESFYSNQWSLDECERYSVFVSQGNYPIKGLHHMIEALADIVKVYPKAKLYVAGTELYRDDNFVGRIKISGYGRYIMKLIRQYHLEDSVFFIGNLSEGEMCNQFLKSHVFAMPSAIENSPNSLGEAMLLGMPCVAADVGGISSMFVHGKDGFLYQANAPYMLAYYIKRIFACDTLCYELSEVAKKRAKTVFNVGKNVVKYLGVYHEIVSE